MTPADMPDDAIRAARLLHVSAISQAISPSAADAVFHAIAVARSADVAVSYDTNYRPALWPLDRARAITHAALSQATIALPGLDDARLLTGRNDPAEICAYYLSLGCRIVALTLGAEGSMVADAGATRIVPGQLVDAVDATGAGDTFDGAFLAEWLAGHDLLDAARYANMAAALSTQSYGAIDGIPVRSAVEARL